MLIAAQRRARLSPSVQLVNTPAGFLAVVIHRFAGQRGGRARRSRDKLPTVYPEPTATRGVITLSYFWFHNRIVLVTSRPVHSYKQTRGSVTSLQLQADKGICLVTRLLVCLSACNLSAGLLVCFYLNLSTSSSNSPRPMPGMYLYSTRFTQSL